MHTCMHTYIYTALSTVHIHTYIHTYRGGFHVLVDVYLHLHRALQILDELRRHRRHMVHPGVLEHGAESGLLHRL